MKPTPQAIRATQSLRTNIPIIGQMVSPTEAVRMAEIIDYEMGGWRPIEKAPKDGTELDVWREDTGILRARWIAPIDFLTDREAEESQMSIEELEESDWFYTDFITGGRMDDAPTHFRELPTPPQPTKQNATTQN